MAGRRSNGHVFGDERMLYDSSDVSPSLRGASARVLSQRDAHFYLSSGASEWKNNSKMYKNRSKKLGSSYPSFNNNQQMVMMPYSPKSTSGNKRNAIQQWDPESPGHHLDSSDLHEFRLRDACGAATHAVKLARLKREKAQRLFFRADAAMQKAVVALMNAEAIKEPLDSSIDIS